MLNATLMSNGVLDFYRCGFRLNINLFLKAFLCYVVASMVISE
jgi:hypothetical protein